MRKLMLILLLAAAVLFAAETEYEKLFREKTGEGGLPEIFHDWRALAVAAIMTSVVLIGIAYAVGTAMDMAEMKAWASNEVVQAFANVLIIILLVATIALLDVTAEEMVRMSGLNIACTGGQSCLGNVSVAYLQSYIDVAKADAKDVAIKSIEAAGWANRRFGLYCTSILCLQLGASFSLTGNYMLDQDRYMIVFEYYAGLISSLEAQKFFVSKIAFNVGPLLLAMGIVARSFFFTRKLGGLLIALAAGIMFFLPGMYVFDWVTLDTTLTGDKANEDADPGLCPPECQMQHPLAVVENGTSDVLLGTVKDVYDIFPDSQVTTAQAIVDGSVSSGSPVSGPYSGKNVISCMVVSDTECPLACRELPYPTSHTQCMNQSANVPQNCAQIPDKCWLRRLATPLPSDAEQSLSTCPNECKVIPPMKGDCDTGDCLTSRPECRVYKRVDDTGNPASDFEWAPYPTKDAGDDQYNRCVDAKDCAPAYSAFSSCAYVVPQTGSCTELCSGCPEICRVETGTISNLPAQCRSGGSLISACTRCPAGCKVDADHIEDVQQDACTGCLPERRIITYSETMPSEYITGACSISTNCKQEDRVPVPRYACSQCVFAEESEMYVPAIQTLCTDYCKPSDDVPAKSSDEYTKIGGEGLVGTPEVQNLSKLMLPAYVLPLFNIVVTLVFIKGLSTVLGGDIEIPGISKVF